MARARFTLRMLLCPEKLRIKECDINVGKLKIQGINMANYINTDGIMQSGLLTFHLD